jgi:hypothetical protein
MYKDNESDKQITGEYTLLGLVIPGLTEIPRSMGLLRILLNPR